MEIKEIRKEFNKNEYLYKQIVATEKGYIYELTSENITRYEVFKRKVNTQYNIYSFPGNESFGIWAWSVVTLGYAKDRLNRF